MIDYLNLDMFGSPFEEVETYVYYDGPQTFAMRSVAMPDLYYFVNTAEEDEGTGAMTALAVGVGTERFHAIRSGVVTFKDAFVSPGNTLYVIREHADDAGADVELALPFDIPDSWLPLPDARLDLPTATAVAFDPTELQTLRLAESRSIFAVEVDADGLNMTEFPLAELAEINRALQQVAVEFGHEVRKPKKGRSKKLTGYPADQSRAEIRLTSVGKRAASYVELIAVTSSSGSFFEDEALTGHVADRLRELLGLALNADQVVEGLTKFTSSVVRTGFKRILTNLESAGSGIVLYSATLSTPQIQDVRISRSQVSDSLTRITTVESEPVPIDVPRGILYGSNVKAHKFVLFDAASGKWYSGNVGPDARQTVDGLAVGEHSYVRASLVAKTPFIEGASEIVYTLVSIEPREDIPN